MSKKYIYEDFQIEEYMVKFLESVLSTKWDGELKEIVFLGDSLIRDYDLNKYFVDIKSKLFNCGVSGITTDGLFNIIKQGVVRHNPKVIVILVGTNDLNEFYNRRNEEIISNISKLVTQLKTVIKLVKIVLISILPCDEQRQGKDVIGGGRDNSRIIEINKNLKEFEDYFKDLVYLDVFSSLVDDSGNLSKIYTHDGIHLTLKGYEKMTDLLRPVIDDLID